MDKEFERDPHPGKPKILFIGSAESSHTHSWIDLLAGSELNFRLFGMPTGGPPPDWPVRTYLTTLCGQNDSDTRSNLYKGIVGPLQSLAYQISNYETSKDSNKRLRKQVLALISRSHRLGFRSKTPEAWLAQIIRQWKPDIIHTLGIFDHQGGLFYYRVREQYPPIERIGKWVLQLRGGSDLALRRHIPSTAEQIQRIVSAADQVIIDNVMNISYLAEMGIPEEKFAPVTPIPGTGGLDLEICDLEELTSPSARERMIVWPKAYESQWSKALPVLEAIKTAWPGIQPCEIYLLAITPEVKEWFYTLPEEIRNHCHAFERLERSRVLELMKRARVLLAPSLVDGIPNTMYEAMAYGAFPIVSPLETIRTAVSNGENVLFARNLYPDEIASALVEAMGNDLLVDTAWKNNQAILRKYADRGKNKQKIIDYYSGLCNTA